MSNIIKEDLESIYNHDINWNIFDEKIVLITGAYGMLASYVTYFFIYLHEKKNINVRLILLVRSEERLKNCIGDKLQGYIKVCYDSLEDELHFDEDINFIIHAASLASPQYYARCPVDVLMPNTIGTYHLLKLAIDKRIEGFLLFSTGDIYGYVADKDIVREEDYGILNTLDIHNCYSESKRMAETMCYSFMVQYSIPVKIARIWHTYAPTMDVRRDPRVFASFVRNVIDGENIEMKSDGSGRRTFCYITDAVWAFFKILLEGQVGEAYNVCNESQFVSILELAETIVELRSEQGLKVIRKERSTEEHYVENIHLEGREMCPTSDKLRTLGWKPTVDLKTGFDRVLQHKNS